MPCHTLECPAIHWDALSYVGMPRHTLGYLAIHWDTLPYIGIPCHTLGCLVIRWDAFLYTGMPCHTLGCLATHWDALPYIEMPCHTLGCPPSTVLTFWGIEFGTVCGELRLPAAKLGELKLELSAWLVKSSCSKRELIAPRLT